MKKLLNILTSFSLAIFIICGSIIVGLKCKSLYYYDVKKLNISDVSGFSDDEIKLNYDYLIDYNLNNKVEEFNLPTIKYSTQGKIHFEEVRDIFQNVKKLNNITLIFLIIGIYISIRNNDLSILKYSAITLILIPLILIMPILINFQKSFEIFHNILFGNDYWIFDPNLDSVINILPAEFFLHSGIMILILIFIISLLMIFSYKKLNKRSSN